MADPLLAVANLETYYGPIMAIRGISFTVLEFERAHARQEQELFHEPRALVGVAAEQEVLEHGGVLEQLDVLEGPRDPAPGDLVGRHARDVLAVEDQASGRWLVDARDQVEDRRLPGAVGADDREDLAGLDREAHPVDGPDAAEAHPEVVDREEAHRRRSERM